MPYAQDGEFSPEEFVQRFNSDLCNDLGNLLLQLVGIQHWLEPNIVSLNNAIFSDSANHLVKSEASCFQTVRKSSTLVNLPKTIAILNSFFLIVANDNNCVNGLDFICN